MKTSTTYILIICISSFLFSCDWKSETPSGSDIDANTSVKAFIVDSSKIEGIYKSQDVDSLLFSYKTSIDSPDNFAVRIRKNASNEGWKEIKAEKYYRFERIRKWSTEYYIGEEVRIAYLKNIVVVAYVEGSTKQAISSFSEIDESKWAERFIWPMFEKELTRL